jgi:6-phosphofructokinase 1
MIADKLKLKARFDKPGTIQRVSMVCASEVDLKEAYEVGKRAVKEALGEKSGFMITLVREPGDKYKCSTGTIALSRVANRVKTLPNSFINQAGNDVTRRFTDWLRPLLGSPLMEYAHLRGIRVSKKLQAFSTKK